MLDGPLASPDQAYYLAAYGPECFRKALLPAWVHKVLGHAMGSTDDAILEVVEGIDPGLSRYPVRAWRNYPQLREWKPDARYAATGECAARAREMVGEAREVADNLLLLMWADGLVPSEVLGSGAHFTPATPVPSEVQP